MNADAAQFRDNFQSLQEQLQGLVRGQDEAIRTTLLALACGGHVLLDGPSGVGKSYLALSLSRLVSLAFQRIQFTPDLTPADIIGTYVVLESHGRRKFEFQQGPMFTNLLLADEINRATPKAQAALLESMEDGSVSVANESYELPQPFFVIATRGESEGEGVFPLPAPQLDRFLFRVRLQSPDESALHEILRRAASEPTAPPESSFDRNAILAMCSAVRAAPVSDAAVRAAADIVRATQPDNPDAPELCRKYLEVGVSPRAGAAMLLGAKAAALLEGDGEASAEHVRRIAPLALKHRLQRNYDGFADSVSPQSLVDAALQAAS